MNNIMTLGPLCDGAGCGVVDFTQSCRIQVSSYNLETIKGRLEQHLRSGSERRAEVREMLSGSRNEVVEFSLARAQSRWAISIG